MTTEISRTNGGKAEAYELALIGDDLSKLSTEERLAYNRAKCESLGLNELTNPFKYINLNGKLVHYATRDCSEQLRKINSVSLEIVSREKIGDLYVVTARATDKTGRRDESTGVVTLGGLKGDQLANALMKAETKAKRRVTLSICGLGCLDESEIETVAGARIEALVAPQASIESSAAPAAVNDDAEPREIRPHVGKNGASNRGHVVTGGEYSPELSTKALWKLFFDLKDAGHDWPRFPKGDSRIFDAIKSAVATIMQLPDGTAPSGGDLSGAIKAVQARGIAALLDPAGESEGAMEIESGIEFADEDIPF